MKKVLIFNSGSLLYGAEKGLLNLIKAVGDRYDVTVALPNRGPLVKHLKAQGIKMVIFPLAVLSLSPSPVYYIKYLIFAVMDFLYFSVYIRRNKIDIIYTNNSLLIFPSFIASFLRKRHIWHIREFFHISIANKIISILARRLSSVVICQSKNIRNVLFVGVSERAKVIYEGLDIGKDSGYNFRDIREQLNIPKDTVVLSIVSRIHPLKGQYEFVKTFLQLFKEPGNKTVLLMVGDISPGNSRNRAYKSKIQSFIRDNGLEDRIFLLGFREDTKEIFHSTDIAIFPFRRNEPFGLALLEALIFSDKVFLNPNPGSNEIASFYNGRCRKLSMGLLKEAIKDKQAIRPEHTAVKPQAYLPEEFSSKAYERDLLSVMEKA